MPQLSNQQLAGLKILVFLACLLPLAELIFGILSHGLGANPVEAVIRGLGDWALRFLLLTLAITPLRRLFSLPWLLRLRRMLGLYSFFYALLHVSTYVAVDQEFEWLDIAHDIAKRPFITVGFLAFLLLLPLAATSTNAMIRRLGGKRWQALHRAVYAIGVLGVLHYAWMVKADLRQPLIYAAILAVLLGLRLVWRLKQARQARASAPGCGRACGKSCA